MKKQKNNKYASISSPQAELDFHERGILTENDIKKITDTFLTESKNKGYTKLLIITGKGLHSHNGKAVIKPFLQKYLNNHPDVISVFEGRRDRGGSGALEITLN